MDALISMDRIEHFLLEPELHPELATKNKNADESHLGIKFRNASFSYGPHGKIPQHPTWVADDGGRSSGVRQIQPSEVNSG